MGNGVIPGKAWPRVPHREGWFMHKKIPWIHCRLRHDEDGGDMFTWEPTFSDVALSKTSGRPGQPSRLLRAAFRPESQPTFFFHFFGPSFPVLRHVNAHLCLLYFSVPYFYFIICFFISSFSFSFNFILNVIHYLITYCIKRIFLTVRSSYLVASTQLGYLISH